MFLFRVLANNFAVKPISQNILLGAQIEWLKNSESSNEIKNQDIDLEAENKVEENVWIKTFFNKMFYQFFFVIFFLHCPKKGVGGLDLPNKFIAGFTDPVLRHF